MEVKYSLAAYEDFHLGLLAEVRLEAFGEDIGQFSWVTGTEYRAFLDCLNLSPGSILLDVACGSGGLSLYAANRTGCTVVGIDLSEEAVQSATESAGKANLQERARFFQHDASSSLPLETGSIGAILCIDAINHIVNRAELFSEWHRVLRPGGRFLFTDAVVAAGPLLLREILARSYRMGEFVFTPPGSHEACIQNAGFVDIRCQDVTATIATTAQRWHDARANRHQAFEKFEGTDCYRDMQQMLATAALLARERRLLRLAFSGEKRPGRG